MAAVAITPDQDVVSCEMFIAAPPARVFQALTDPRQMLQWWGQKEMYRTTKFETDVRVHGKWMSAGVSATGETFQVSGEYLEVDPPRLLVYTWLATWTGALQTTVRWELESHNGGTLVKIHHSGFAGHADAAQSHGQGWERVLSWMQAFVEKGETIDTRH
ncbi:MAG: SRPBCC domain-containing protein [Candidatus Sulfotelmatobacter sp.]